MYCDSREDIEGSASPNNPTGRYIQLFPRQYRFQYALPTERIGGCFRRLQEEFSKSSADKSIFAWPLAGGAVSDRTNDRRLRGVLATPSVTFQQGRPVSWEAGPVSTDVSVTNDERKRRVHLWAECGSSRGRWVLFTDCWRQGTTASNTFLRSSISRSNHE
jgi:hypothetical protein